MTSRRRTRIEPTQIPFTPPQISGVVWGYQTEHRPLECWLPGAIPAASLVKIEGRKSTGKSSVAAAIAACVSGGPAIPGWTGPRNRRVLWQAGEEDWLSVAGPRLAEAGCPDGMYARLEVTDRHGRLRRPVLPDDLTILTDTLRDGDFGLLVMDPYSSMTHSSIDLSIPQQGRRYFESIAEILPPLNVVCICVGHIRKGRGGDAREAGYGSAEVTNVMRSVLRCDEHPHRGGDRVLSVVAYNYGPTLPTQVYRLYGAEGHLARVVWGGPCDLDAETICEGRGPEGERDEWSDADALLALAIGGSWVQVGDIEREALAASISPRTLRRAKARLRVPSRRVQARDTGYWEWGPPVDGWPEGLASPYPDTEGAPPPVAPLASLPETSEDLPEKPKRRRGSVAKAATADATTPAGQDGEVPHV